MASRKSTTLSISEKLNGLQNLEKRIEIQKGALLQKALESDNPNDLMKANQILQNIDYREHSERKSFLIDPNDPSSFNGYKQKPLVLSYSVLRRMSYGVPIIRSIINTRIDQITRFCEPQNKNYNTGFIIRKKRGYFGDDEQTKPTQQEYREMNEIAEIIMNCGVAGSFNEDDFDSFTRKVMNDSLTFDQMNFETVPSRSGKVFEYIAADAATIRIADTYGIENKNYNLNPSSGIYQSSNPNGRKKVKGYLPAYCQIIDEAVTAEYYPWEMCFGVRNPSTNIYSNGYGISEIEILMNTITSMLWADEYNRKFFSQGSAPKGFFKIKPESGIVGTSKIAEFKRNWQATMAGVNNSHKTPVLSGDIDWVDLQKTNREMEFSSWIEFLIKVSCAIYRIDPSEVNFHLSGGSNSSAMFEGSGKERLAHSKEKGLKPLLKFYQRRLNKNLVSLINPKYEMIFVGVDDEDPDSDIDRDAKMVANFMTVDEIRIKRGLKPLGSEKGGDIILSSVWTGALNMRQQQQMQMMMADAEGGDGQYEDDGDDESPFDKALTDYWDKLMKSESN